MPRSASILLIIIVADMDSQSDIVVKPTASKDIISASESLPIKRQASGGLFVYICSTVLQQHRPPLNDQYDRKNKYR
jgi:hypothetical protein